MLQIDKILSKRKGFHSKSNSLVRELSPNITQDQILTKKKVPNLWSLDEKKKEQNNSLTSSKRQQNLLYKKFPSSEQNSSQEQNLNNKFTKTSFEELTSLEQKLQNLRTPKKAKFPLTKPNLSTLILACSKKLEGDPQDLKALFIRASSLLKQTKYDMCIKDCEQIIKVEESNLGTFYLKGSAEEKLNRVQEAINSYTKVLEIDPGHVNARFSRAACFNKIVNDLFLSILGRVSKSD
jgi:tetratricopeptide (TPR) repeat protein